MTMKATVRAAFSLTGLGNDRKFRIAMTIERRAAGQNGSRDRLRATLAAEPDTPEPRGARAPRRRRGAPVCGQRATDPEQLGRLSPRTRSARVLAAAPRPPARPPPFPPRRRPLADRALGAIDRGV